MCIAIYAPHDAKEITLKQFENMARQNNDGMGLMWVDNGRIEMFKMMCATDRLWEKGKKSSTLNPEFVADVKQFWNVYKGLHDLGFDTVIHFRYATHGKVCIANTHPFFFTEDKRVAFVHNGILSVPSTDEVSDTRMYGYHFLKYLQPGWLDDNVARDLVENTLGGSKLVIMDVEGRVDILNMKRGEWSGGNWFSNDGYRGQRTYGWSSGSYSGYYGNYGRGLPVGTRDYDVEWEEVTKGEKAKASSGTSGAKGTGTKVLTLADVCTNCPEDIANIPLDGTGGDAKVLPVGGDFAEPVAYWLKGDTGVAHVIACGLCMDGRAADVQDEEVVPIQMPELHEMGYHVCCDFCGATFDDELWAYEQHISTDEQQMRSVVRQLSKGTITTAPNPTTVDTEAEEILDELSAYFGELTDFDRSRIMKDALTTDEIALLSSRGFDVWRARVVQRLRLRNKLEAEGGHPEDADHMDMESVRYELWLRERAEADEANDDDGPDEVEEDEAVLARVFGEGGEEDLDLFDADVEEEGAEYGDSCDPCRLPQTVYNQ